MAAHTHQYQRAKLGKDYTVYRCVLPNCPHYISAELIVNRFCLCNRCKKTTFIIKKDRRGNVLAKPHCEACTKESNNPEFRKKERKKNVPATKSVEEFAAKLLGTFKV